jgi:hypothetical protein
VQRNTRSLVSSVIALCVMLSLQAAVRADTFHRVAVNGTYHITPGSTAATGINVSATSSPTSTGTLYGGTITLTGPGLSFHTGVTGLTVDSMTVNGVAYKHAKVTSTTISYLGQAAHIGIETAAYTSLGEGGYQVVRNSDGVVLTASWPNGFYQMFPFQLGGVSIL